MGGVSLDKYISDYSRFKKKLEKEINPSIVCSFATQLEGKDFMIYIRMAEAKRVKRLYELAQRQEVSVDDFSGGLQTSSPQ